MIGPGLFVLRLFPSLPSLGCLKSSDARDYYMATLVILNLGGLNFRVKYWVHFAHQGVCLSCENVECSQEFCAWLSQKGESWCSRRGGSVFMKLVSGEHFQQAPRTVNFWSCSLNFLTWRTLSDPQIQSVAKTNWTGCLVYGVSAPWKPDW